MMNRTFLFLLVIGVILLTLSLFTSGPTGAHPALQITSTPSVFDRLPLVARNFSGRPISVPTAVPYTVTPTPTATNTPTQTPTPTATPTQTPTPTPTITTEPGIYGKATYNGAVAPGIELKLRFYNGTSWSTAAATTTDSNGNYRFTDVPELGAGQTYYVRYGPNRSEPSYLSNWSGPTITSYTAGTSVHGGDFDIANVDLESPEHQSTLPLPVTFTWTRRNIATDTYRWVLFDPSGSDDRWITDDLGYADSFALRNLPSGAEYGKEYGWYVQVYNGPDSFGTSHYYRSITFTPTFTPRDGRWTGRHSDRGAIDFRVSSGGTSLSDLELFQVGRCRSVEYFCSVAITNNQFIYNCGSGSISGQFTSATTASGDFTIDSFACGYVSGTWDAAWVGGSAASRAVLNPETVLGASGDPQDPLDPDQITEKVLPDWSELLQRGREDTREMNR